MSKYIFSGLFILIIFRLNMMAQVSGCTDPQANNYVPGASLNDGSCIYNSTSFTPQTLINPLGSEVSETSGLLYFSGRLWTHNDSGGDPCIYSIDTLTGNVIQKITLYPAVNTDWEDMTHDSLFIYIADAGNNNGNRTDLRIYKVPKDQIPISGDDTIAPGVIHFTYPDQTNFTSQPNANDFDCEAILSYGDSLLLFSKNWVNLKTRLYSVPKDTGMFTARLLDSLNTGGMITGCCHNDISGEIVLCGYNVTQYTIDPFLWLLFDFQANNIFSGNKRKIEMNLLWTQAEAVCPVAGKRYMLTNEKVQQIITIQPKLFAFGTGLWTDVQTTEVKKNDASHAGINIWPNPACDEILISSEKPFQGNVDVTFFNLYGKAIRTLHYPQTDGIIRIERALFPENGQLFIIKVEDNTRYSVQRMITYQP